MTKNEKGDLYSKVASLKKLQGSVGIEGITVIEEARSMGIKVEALNFVTPGLRGVAVISGSEIHNPDIILLNSNRTPKEQNFDCAHELMHIYLHGQLKKRSFQCYDGRTFQNSYIEWQADEGAAEYCVPAAEFIPITVERLENTALKKNECARKRFCKEMSDLFLVPEKVIAYRLDNLQYEMWQYMQGVPVQEWEFLSRGEQNRRGIVTPTLTIVR